MDKLPQWLSGHLTRDDVVRISTAVSKAEEKTTAEIVPMVVGRSIVTGHVPWILFLIALPLAWTLIPLHGWQSEGLSIVIAFVVTVVFHRFAFVQRIFTPNTDEILSVNRRALLEFHLANLRSTQGSTGVLIFVSMLERRVVVLADDAITSRCPSTFCHALIQILTDKIKQGKFADGMVEAIEHLGALMAEHLPASSHTVNELPNALVIKD